MRLKMVKGREASLIIEDVKESITQDGFLESSYTKALYALCNYIERTDPIRKALSKEQCLSSRNQILYCSPQNIIAFSGKRGCGKSSSLLSFSNLLGKGKDKSLESRSLSEIRKEYASLENRRFVVVDPIDPTALEQNQSILSVILSRLLFLAEGEWSRNASFYGGFQDKESQKTDLLTLARQCLSGICAIKENEKFPQDLSDLQRVGDSSILKKNLYDFVELILHFCWTDRGIHGSGDLLVLQIDDTDCQISQGHEIMDDIRKYLTIPNVVILMATDTKLLRQVLTQHYVSDFQDNLSQGLIMADEVWALGEKYLAKLMPPSYVIHLPNIDDVIREKADQIYFYYYNSEAEKLLQKTNLLDPCEGKPYEHYDFQSVLLRYIYRKTHIAFTVHDAYANNIIPTTLRGLAYLLSQLSSMENIPEIDFAHEPFDAKYLVQALEAQFELLEKNLNLFEEYFLHDWIPAKLPQKLVEIVEKLGAQALDQRIPYIMRELTAYYGEKVTDAKLFQYAVNDDYSRVTYADLDEQIRVIQGTHQSSSQVRFRQKEDFYFIFAIRTLLTIKNNKELLRLKRRTLSCFDLDNKDLLIFDYLNGKTSIPTGFYLDPVNLYGYQLSEGEGVNYNDRIKEVRFRRKGDRELFKNLYFDSDYHSDGVVRRFNFTGGIVKWLSPETDDLEKMGQREIFIAQEAAALMATNCDVQEVGRKAIVLAADTGSYPRAKNFSEAVEQGLGLMQNAIAHMNQGMLLAYEPTGSEKTAWKLSPRWRVNLNTFYKQNVKKAKKLPKSDEIKKTSDLPYPKFEAKPPTQYNESYIQHYLREVRNYTEKLKKALSDNNLQLNSSTVAVIHELVSFKFKGDQSSGVTNYDDFEALLKRLYDVLDTLSSHNPDT